MVKVTVKWGKEKFEDVELDTSSDLQTFKAVLFSLTNVPVPKQKVLYKGSVLKDEANLEALKIPDGAVIMLMGSAEERKIEEPSKKTVFLEDLTPDERAKLLKEKTGEALPCGLVNMGNTCYMNASLQCLRRINEFKEVVTKFKEQGGGDPMAKLTGSLSRLFNKLESKGDPVMPMEFFNVSTNNRLLTIARPSLTSFLTSVKWLKKVYTSNRMPMSASLASLIWSIPISPTRYQSLIPYVNSKNEEGDKFDLVDYLFKIELQATLTCIENPEEPPEVKTETLRKLPCIIDNQSNPINHLHEGIQAGLEETLEKNSPSLGRLAQYKKVSRLKKLPPYLVVQKIRFLWKKAVESTGSKATKAKILRNVSFPRVLDMYQFCTDELKKILDTGREYEKKQLIEKSKIEGDKFEEYKKKLEAEGKILSEDTRELFKKWKEEQKEEEIKEHDEKLYRKHGTGLETGNYELIAVLTHKGRTSDSGHYVAWVHRRGDEWLKYDDDVVTVVSTEEIMNLRGGGDWHMAYYCIYRKIEVA